jgi:hypothetical protein
LLLYFFVMFVPWCMGFLFLNVTVRKWHHVVY